MKYSSYNIITHSIDRFIIMKLGHKENELQDFKVRLLQLLDPMESIPAIDKTVELKMVQLLDSITCLILNHLNLI